MSSVMMAMALIGVVVSVVGIILSAMHVNAESNARDIDRTVHLGIIASDSRAFSLTIFYLVAFIVLFAISCYILILSMSSYNRRVIY